MRKSILLLIALSVIFVLATVSHAEKVSVESENGAPVELEKSVPENSVEKSEVKVEKPENVPEKKNTQESNRAPLSRFDPWSIFDEFEEEFNSLWSDDFFPSFFHPFRRRPRNTVNKPARIHPFKRLFEDRFKHFLDFANNRFDTYDKSLQAPESRSSSETGLVNTYGSLDILSDVRKLKDRYIVEASIPGFDKSEISIQLSENPRGKPVLTIEGKKHEVNKETQDGSYVLRERSDSFSRSYVFESPIVEGGVKAKFDKGVLSVELPYTQADNAPKRIDIQ